MAFLQVSFMSKSLMRTVPLQVVLPVDRFAAAEEGWQQKPFKTLYLLHGLLGSHTDWINNTKIQRWAEERNLAVVMPAGENSFYIDRPDRANRYGEFIGKELVEMTRRMFPLSHKREDTFIGGLSMGGFGALRNGLKYNDTFGAIVALSSAVHMLELGDNLPESVGIEEPMFGNLDIARESDKNPRWLIERLWEKKTAGENVNIPAIFMACGTGDGLYGVNCIYRDLLREKGFDLTWISAPGKHDWYFWDTYILEGLKWLPLEEAKDGLHSGNVLLPADEKK